ncbi:MAG: CRISPR-associated helicase Cas3' [Marinifilaceae bacterium]
MEVCKHIKAKGLPEETSLYSHLSQVAQAAIKFADYLGMDKDIAYKGAVLHDIGKASTVFQKRLKTRVDRDKPFRHEIASCFFLSLFDENIHGELIEMVIAHHKSIEDDVSGRGILDLIENYRDPFALHIKDWDLWKNDALKILESLGIPVRDISKEEAEINYNKVIDYCNEVIEDQSYSHWRGLLMASDHLASALPDGCEKALSKAFIKPNLSFYNRKHSLYPLSLIDSKSDKRHTMVVACTGAGKTDYLFRRCNTRVFYTLPFQASINAMYRRVKLDLLKDNPNLDIRLLHASSSIEVKGKSIEEKVLQEHVGSSVKILTPHQIASIIFGTKGFEAMALDIKGCDVILDEIHTYTEITRAIVLKIVEVLNVLSCRIHIGTATMPSILYNRIIDILGKDNVLEVKLEDKKLNEFDRHIINKIDSWEESTSLIQDNLTKNNKILIVCNRIKDAQEQYFDLKEQYPDIPILLLHSRFKRRDRNEKERELMVLNASEDACIVVSTQVVEVSLDISFDVMITQAAPLDALIQRFGRVNRKRNEDTIGKYKPIYILAPPDDEKEALPYNLDIINRSYDVLPNAEVLHECDIQSKIDKVFTDIDFLEIEQHSIYKKEGYWNIDKLTNSSKSIVLDLLEIDSVACICEEDEEAYEEASYEDKKLYEISVRFYMVKNYEQLRTGSRPFIIPDESYTVELGLDFEKLKNAKYNPEKSFL